MHRRVCAAHSVDVIFEAQARKLILPGSLGWAERVPKRRARSSNGDKATELYREKTQVFGSLGRFSFDLADRGGGKIGLAATMIIFETPLTGYDVRWSVGMCAAIAPVTSR